MIDLTEIEARLAAEKAFAPRKDPGGCGHYMMIYGSDDLPDEVYDFYDHASDDMANLLAEVKRLTAELASSEDIRAGMSEESMYYSQLTEENDRLTLEVERLREELRGRDNCTYCAYCGERFGLDDAAATLVSNHIASCEKHPMRVVERERDEALSEVARLTAGPVRRRHG